MRELLHQVRLRGLMRIVTLDAIGGGEGLSLVRLQQVGGGWIVTIEAERRRRLGQVIVELLLAFLARLVGSVAGVATHIERGVAAALLGNIQSLGVALKAEILAFVAGGRLQQLILVVRLMRAVALDAVANRRRMNRSLDGSRVHVGVTGDAKRLRRRGDQLNASDVFAHPDFVTTGAARCYGGMNELALGFVFVTLNACRRIGIWFQRYWMDGSKQLAGAGQQSPRQYDPHKSAHNCLQPLPRNLCTTIAAARVPRQESPHTHLSLSSQTR